MTIPFDIIIVGGGPAGLSAALIAGRGRRRALLIDGGVPRNSAAPAMHSFLSRDGILPRDFRTLSHAELTRYQTVERRDDMVIEVAGSNGEFDVRLAGGSVVRSKKIILALGMVDTLPAIDGLADFWGKGVHACPYCDGFEHSDQWWGVLADQPMMFDHALFLRGWTSNLTVFAQGTSIPSDKRVALESAGIRIEAAPIARVLGGDGHSLRGVELRGGETRPIESLWIKPLQAQTALVQQLSLQLREDGAIARGESGETSVPGIFATGDCAAGPVQQAILAAGDSARVTFPMVRSLVLAGLA